MQMMTPSTHTHTERYKLPFNGFESSFIYKTGVEWLCVSHVCLWPVLLFFELLFLHRLLFLPFSFRFFSRYISCESHYRTPHDSTLCVCVVKGKISLRFCDLWLQSERHIHTPRKYTLRNARGCACIVNNISLWWLDPLKTVEKRIASITINFASFYISFNRNENEQK